MVAHQCDICGTTAPFCGSCEEHMEAGSCDQCDYVSTYCLALDCQKIGEDKRTVIACAGDGCKRRCCIICGPKNPDKAVDFCCSICWQRFCASCQAGHSSCPYAADKQDPGGAGDGSPCSSSRRGSGHPPIVRNSRDRVFLDDGYPGVANQSPKDRGSSSQRQQCRRRFQTCIRLSKMVERGKLVARPASSDKSDSNSSCAAQKRKELLTNAGTGAEGRTADRGVGVEISDPGEQAVVETKASRDEALVDKIKCKYGRSGCTVLLNRDVDMAKRSTAVAKKSPGAGREARRHRQDGCRREGSGKEKGETSKSRSRSRPSSGPRKNSRPSSDSRKNSRPSSDRSRNDSRDSRSGQRSHPRPSLQSSDPHAYRRRDDSQSGSRSYSRSIRQRHSDGSGSRDDSRSGPRSREERNKSKSDRDRRRASPGGGGKVDTSFDAVPQGAVSNSSAASAEAGAARTSDFANALVAPLPAGKLDRFNTLLAAKRSGARETDVGFSFSFRLLSEY